VVLQGGIDMKKTALAVTLVLAGCTTTTPVRTADGNYMVSARAPFSGQSGALQQAINQANTFCESKGEVVKLVSNTAQECALHGGCGEAQITFACAKAAP
jgi:ketopantoate hydroxymethyltransferase